MSKLAGQIVRYGVIGAFATAINIAVAEACAAWVWPCLSSDDVFVRLLGLAQASVPDAVRAERAVACNLVGFFVANVVCWLLNRRFVFTPGRHHWFLEWIYFLAGSGFAIFCGSVAIWALVRYFGVQTSYSFAVNVLISVAVNFVVRKFFVFKG